MGVAHVRISISEGSMTQRAWGKGITEDRPHWIHDMRDSLLNSRNRKSRMALTYVTRFSHLGTEL